MGAVYSKVKILRVAVKQVLALNSAYSRLLERIEADPGLPVKNPTLSFWHDVPSPLASHRPDTLPSYADVVIIGSGITGTSVARTLLLDGANENLRIVMLEAREVCSGATGRNGGHIKPPLHHDYSDLKARFGRQQAEKTIRFRLLHLDEMLRVAASDQILKECQCRDVESLDVYFDTDMFKQAKNQLWEWKDDMPHEARDYFCIEGEKAVDRFHLSSDVAGVIYNRAGAVHPYRFVTCILARLLDKCKRNFCLSAHTPCTTILPPSASTPSYTVITPQGAIFTPHVVHATNAWTSHLLEKFRTKIFPVRGNMTAQRPGDALSPSTLDGGRSWVFYDKHMGYDYLTQLPNCEQELMFGGGFFQGGDDALSELGTTDDSKINPGIAAHLAGALPIHFGSRNWGRESAPSSSSPHGGSDDEQKDKRWSEGRCKAMWSGIIGISADRLPWVGRIPPKLAERAAPLPLPRTLGSTNPQCSREKLTCGFDSKRLSRPKTASPGEWLAAGYSGEGMAHAYMSGRALALQILGRDADAAPWLPDCLSITEERWKKARAEDLIEELWG